MRYLLPPPKKTIIPPVKIKYKQSLHISITSIRKQTCYHNALQYPLPPPPPALALSRPCAVFAPHRYSK